LRQPIAFGVLRRFYDFLNLGGVVRYVPPRLVRRKSTNPIPSLLPRHRHHVSSQRHRQSESSPSGSHVTAADAGCESDATKARNLGFSRAVLFEFTDSAKYACFPDSKCFCLLYGLMLGNRKRVFVFQDDRPPKARPFGIDELWFCKLGLTIANGVPAGNHQKKSEPSRSMSCPLRMLTKN